LFVYLFYNSDPISYRIGEKIILSCRTRLLPWRSVATMLPERWRSFPDHGVGWVWSFRLMIERWSLPEWWSLRSERSLWSIQSAEHSVAESPERKITLKHLVGGALCSNRA